MGVYLLSSASGRVCDSATIRCVIVVRTSELRTAVDYKASGSLWNDAWGGIEWAERLKVGLAGILSLTVSE